MKFFKTIIFLAGLAIITIGCSSSNQEAGKDDNSTLTIYTTVYPIQYAVEQIAGDRVTTESVYPPGVDAHTYEPTSRDITTIAESDAFFYLGAGMEGFAETAADALDSQSVKLIEIGKHEQLFSDSEDTHEHNEEAHSNDDHNHGDLNPHIWLDPVRMIEMAHIIKDELVELNPENQELFNENLEVLEEELLELDHAFSNALDTKTNKKILVSHAAFGYWEERYGIEQISVHGVSSTNEPSQKELIEIIDEAEKHELEYIIFEQNVSTKISEIIRDQIDAETLVIHNLSTLTDEDISNDEDYISLMKRNLDVLDKATK
ncbi:metal ABC transporter solute-binding protein, Zn/Mn family [Virgibacillus ainsalahensis]